MCTLRSRIVILGSILCLLGAALTARAQQPAARGDEVLTLEQAIAIALRDNPKVQNAALDVNRTLEEFAATRTRRLPSFNFEAIGSQQLTPISFTFERGVFGTFPGIGPIPNDTTRISTPMRPTAIFTTRITQPLTQLYQINLNLKQLRLKNELAQEELRARQQQVVRDVKRAYFALLQTESALRTATETIRMYKELDRVTGEYVARQVALRTESLDVKSRLARSEYDVLTLVDQATTQRQQLNLLLGRDPLTEFAVSQMLDVDGFEADLTAAREQALARRPEVREARLKVKQAEGDRRVKKADYLPDVSASFQQITNANFGNGLIPRNYMNLSLTVSWEVFDWGRKKRELSEKDMATEQARISLKDAERSVVADVNDKFNKLRLARQFVAVVEADRAAAVENVRVIANRYQAQMSLLKDVLQAQSQLEQANHQGRQALLSYWTAKAEFELAIGEER